MPVNETVQNRIISTAELLKIPAPITLSFVHRIATFLIFYGIDFWTICARNKLTNSDSEYT